MGLIALLARLYDHYFGPAPIGDDGCVACGSTDLEMLGPDHYSCRACAYEGGQGHALAEERTALRAIASLSDAERARRAEQGVVSARALLLACEGTLESRGGMSSDLEVSSAEAAYHAALGNLYEAATLLREAQWCDDSVPGLDLSGVEHVDPASLRLQPPQRTLRRSVPGERRSRGLRAGAHARPRHGGGARRLARVRLT